MSNAFFKNLRGKFLLAVVKAFFSIVNKYSSRQEGWLWWNSTSSVTDTRIIIIIIIIKAKETKFLGLSFGLTYKEVQNNLQTPSYNVPLAKLLSELLFLTIIDILTTHN